MRGIAKMHGKETMQLAPTSSRWWRWCWFEWTAAAISALAIGWIVWQCTAYAMARTAYYNEYQRISNMMKSLRERRPQNVSLEEWNATIDWAGGTAQCNIFFSEEHTSFQSMRRFGDRLDDKMKHDIDSSMLVWIEDQFEQTGPHGKQYIRRFGPGAHEYIQAIRRGLKQK
jgi:hypothetical protein